MPLVQTLLLPWTLLLVFLLLVLLVGVARSVVIAAGSGGVGSAATAAGLEGSPDDASKECKPESRQGHCHFLPKGWTQVPLARAAWAQSPQLSFSPTKKP